MLRSFRPTRRKWRQLLGQVAAAVCLSFPISVMGQILYNPEHQTLPEAQGWTYGELGSGIGKSLSEDSVLFDTSAMVSNQAGWSRLAEPALDREAGFTLQFTARLDDEGHISPHRAGFSMIVLGSDAKGIEIGFWTNRIFAQDGPPNLFTHAEDTAFATTDGYVDYALSLQVSNYVLHADGVPILSGPIRDYTSFGGLINPYNIPNFIFVGDDTRSASASVSLKRIVLVRAPELTTSVSGVVSWTGISGLTYAVQTSTNLVDWVDEAQVSSTTGTFCFTNAQLHAKGFLRVVHPPRP